MPMVRPAYESLPSGGGISGIESEYSSENDVEVVGPIRIDQWGDDYDDNAGASSSGDDSSEDDFSQTDARGSFPGGSFPVAIGEELEEEVEYDELYGDDGLLGRRTRGTMGGGLSSPTKELLYPIDDGLALETVEEVATTMEESALSSAAPTGSPPRGAAAMATALPQAATATEPALPAPPAAVVVEEKAVIPGDVIVQDGGGVDRECLLSVADAEPDNANFNEGLGSGNVAVGARGSGGGASSSRTKRDKGGGGGGGNRRRTVSPIPSSYSWQTPPSTCRLSPIPSRKADKSSYLFERFELLSDRDYLHVSETEASLEAYDHDSDPPARVVLKLMKHARHVRAELDGRSGLDADLIVPVRNVFVTRGKDGDDVLGGGTSLGSYNGPIQKVTRDDLAKELSECFKDHDTITDGNVPYPYVLVLDHHGRTLEDVLTHAEIDLPFARKIFKDVLVTLILLHTRKRIHGDLKPRSVVRVGKGWRITDFRSSVGMGESLEDVDDRGGYCPPEVASAALSSSSSATIVADSSYDLWSLGCLLYHLVFASALWTIDRNGRMSPEDLHAVSVWNPSTFLKTAEMRFPSSTRSADANAAIDLIYKLLSSTADERNAIFPFGIISVHQHRFVVGKPLSDNDEDIGGRERTLKRTEREAARYAQWKKRLTLKEEWELKRTRDVLLFGTFESIVDHAPTSFVILDNKLPNRDAASAAQGYEVDVVDRLEEGMRWVQNFKKLGESVKGALNGDVSAIGTFWNDMTTSKMFHGDYLYLYFVDELTGTPVLGNNGKDDDDEADRYPIEIRTWSDVVPKLLPLLHLAARAMALYDGPAGIARMFGSEVHAALPDDVCADHLTDLDNLNDERSPSPFGGTTLAEDVNAVNDDKDKFFRSSNDSVRAASAKYWIEFLRENGRDPRRGGNDDDEYDLNFAGLRRYPDDRGRAIWTTLTEIDDVRRAIASRSEERTNEERRNWDYRNEETKHSIREEIRTTREHRTELGTELGTTRREIESASESLKGLERSWRGTKTKLEKATKELEDQRKARGGGVEADCSCCCS